MVSFAMGKRISAVAASILVASFALCLHESLAFAPVARTSSNRYHPGVKGRENTALRSLTATPDSKLSSATASKTTSDKKRRPSKKGKKPRVAVKNAPKRNRSKGKTEKKTKSFKPLKDLQLGSKVSGKVIDVCDFGAFVDIGYASRGSRAGTALLHISQIQDKKIENIRDVLKVGDVIEGARVINLDLKKGEVGLSLRAKRAKRPDFTKFKVGDTLEGKVASVVSYGAFVDVGVNVNALLHISRITGGAIENVRHHLNEGDPVTVHIIDMDRKKKTLAVSMLDKKADQYLDRRMSQRLKRFYGTASASKDAVEKEDADETSDLDYFDQAIRELEEALQGREE
jgi:predicted RNA-binding protein with RPS1 domain